MLTTMLVLPGQTSQVILVFSYNLYSLRFVLVVNKIHEAYLGVNDKHESPILAVSNYWLCLPWHSLWQSLRGWLYSIIYELIILLEIHVPSLRIALAINMTTIINIFWELTRWKALQAQPHIKLYQAWILKAFNKNQSIIFLHGDQGLVVTWAMVMMHMS